jgi:hypothetical protein
MLNCKNYIIYKFGYQIPMETDSQRTKLYERIREFLDFKKKFINEFNRESIDEMVKYTNFAKYVGITQISYSKNWLFSEIEIGLDMLTEDYKLYISEQYKSLYIAIPKEHVKMVEFVENNKPNWAKNIKILR